MNNVFANQNQQLLNSNPAFKPKNIVEKKAKKMLPDFINKSNLLIVNFFLLLVLLVFNIFTPPFLQNNSVKELIISKANQKSENLKNNSDVTLIKRLSDEDLQILKSENQIQKEIYANALIGDYALIFGENLIIYRHSDNKVIFDGLTPQVELQKRTAEFQVKVLEAAKAESLIDSSTQVLAPSILIVDSGNISETKKINEKFYSDLLEGDVIASFNDKKLLVIYRPAENKIANKSTLSTSLEVK